jgi:hypothetical protein
MNESGATDPAATILIKKRIIQLGPSSLEQRSPTQVLGETIVEVVNGKASSNTKLFAGGHNLTVVEAVVDGRWVAGVLTNQYTIRQGVAWLREAERAMPGVQLLFIPDGEKISVDTLGITKGISAVAVADAVARRRSGNGMPDGLITKGMVAAIHKFAGNEPRTFGTFRKSASILFSGVFKRARALRRARALGNLSEDWEKLLSQLAGTHLSAKRTTEPIQNMDKHLIQGNVETLKSVICESDSQLITFNWKVFALGALVLCMFPPTSDHGDIPFGFVLSVDSVSLGHLIAIIGGWAAGVYLWPDTLYPKLKELMTIMWEGGRK